MVKKYLPLIAFSCLVLAVGVALGMYSHRWDASADLDERVAALELLRNRDVGDWKWADAPLDDSYFDRAGIAGHFSATYTRGASEKLSVLIVCGRSGPISVHTPDVCYTGSGFTAVGDQTKKTIDLGAGRTASVWSLKFDPPSTRQSLPIEVNWAWNGGKGWIAPKETRWTFGGYASLYKVYVVRELAQPSTTKEDDPTIPFLKAFLPETERLFSPKS